MCPPKRSSHSNGTDLPRLVIPIQRQYVSTPLDYLPYRCAEQFFDVLDVVKNLLLVPPPLELRSKVEERKRQRRAAGCIDSEKVCYQSTDHRTVSFSSLLLSSDLGRKPHPLQEAIRDGVEV